MRILVDTSVWVDFFNGHPSAEARELARLIDEEHDIATCGVVLAEFFQGLRDPREAQRAEPFFLDMTYLRPAEPATYLSAAALHRALRQRGVTVRSTIDCIIARLAAENGASVLAKDIDLARIVASGLAPTTPLPAGRESGGSQ